MRDDFAVGPRPDGSRVFHKEASVRVNAPPAQLFAFMDDPRHLAAHMSKSSWMMAGSSMAIETDAGGGTKVGSHIRMNGRVMGLTLALDEVVTEHRPPERKSWQTVGSPRLIVIGPYELGFDIEPLEQGSHLRVFIEYSLPYRGLSRFLGMLFGST